MPGKSGNSKAQENGALTISHVPDTGGDQPQCLFGVRAIAIENGKALKTCKILGNVAARCLKLRRYGNAVTIVFDVEQQW